jgi:thioredoxin 1
MGLLSALFGPKTPEVLPVHITEENFAAEVLRSDLPVVLDVWGPNCAPCKHLAPIVVTLAGAYQGRVKVAELNAAEAPRAAGKLRVMGTPTVLFFKKHREVERVVGFRGELYLREIIDSELLPKTPTGRGEPSRG